MTFERIHNLVRRFVRGGDTENLAGQIQLEALERKQEVTYTLVRRRCYDYLRRLRLEQRYLESWRPASELTEYDPEYAHSLLETAELSVEEKQVLYKVFWQSKPLNITAQELGLTINRTSALLDVAKEKLMFAHYRRTNNADT